MGIRESVNLLEAHIKRKQLIRRLVIVAFAIIMIILGITFSILREASREVTYDDLGFGVVWETVTYNESYTPWIAIFLSAGIVTSVLFICDLLLCRFETICVNGNYLTIYRGALDSIVYVNGEESGRLELFGFTPVVEVILPDKVKATVTFCRSWFVMAHVSFSDNNPSVDI